MIVTAMILLALAFTVILLPTTIVVSAQSNIIDDNFESNNNLTISSPNNQTSKLGQQEQANISTTTDNNNTGSQRLPIISEISDKGVYRVELRWSSPLDIQSPTIISDGGFDIEALFLNASIPEATPQTIPGGQTNLTDTPSVITNDNANLSTIERTTPVKSFDITIYDDEGNELWNKVDQTVTAGRAFLRVALDTDYRGGVTIMINDIRGTDAVEDDSVRFSATLRGNQE